MGRKFKKTVSAILAAAMLMTMLPLQAFAAEADLPEGQTILLPVLEVNEGEKISFPKEEERMMSRSSFSRTLNTVYAPTGVNSYYLNGRIYLDTPIEPSSGAMLQVLAQDGETVLANTTGINYFTKDDDSGYYYIDGGSLTMLAEISAGTYSMQLVAGHDKIAALTDIVFTDEPLLSSATLHSFYVGATSCDVYVTLYHFTEDQMEQLTFSLLNSSNEIVGQTDGAYRDLHIGGDGIIYAGTQMHISGDVQSGEEYSLAITYTGAGTLCDATGGIAIGSPSPPSSAYPEIQSFNVIDPQTSKVEISADQLVAGDEYVLTVRDGFYGNILHQSTVDGANNPFVVNLTLNGLAAPITSFFAYNFYVTIQQADGGGSDSKYFENPYADASGGYVSFDPYYINSATTTLPFRLKFSTGSTVYTGGNNFTITVQDRNGNTLSSVAGNQTTITRDGGNYTISGTLHFTSLPAGSAYIYFNAQQVADIFVLDALQSYGGIDTQDYDNHTFWLMMGQLYLKTDVINSSGTAQLVLRDQDGNTVADSGLVTGAPSEYVNHLNYTFSLTPSLIDGNVYSLLLVSGSSEYALFSDYAYDGTLAFDVANDLYIEEYNASVEDESLAGRVYGSPNYAKNVTDTYLHSLVTSLVLTDASGTQNVITGYANGRFAYGNYYFDINLTSPLAAGDYTLTYPDGSSATFTVSGSSSEDLTPTLYGNDAGDGYAMGSHLPTDVVYTGKIYSGYTCLTGAPFTLTLSGAYTGSAQYLYIPDEVMSGLTSGSYELRVYMDGVLFGATTLAVSSAIQTFVYAYDPNESGYEERYDLTFTSGYVAFEVIGGNCTALRFSEDPAQLSAKAYDSLIYNYRYELSEGDGEKVLYVQLKDSANNESDVIELKIYRLLGDAGFAIAVHDGVQGVYGRDSITFNVGADSQYCYAYVDFVDGKGDIQTSSLNYQGPGYVTGFSSSGSANAVLESSHDYAHNTDQTWTYTLDGNPSGLFVTFSDDTATEANYDYIEVYDGPGNLVGRYSGTSLAGLTLPIAKDTVKVRLTSNGSVSEYGFRITGVERAQAGDLAERHIFNKTFSTSGYIDGIGYIDDTEFVRFYLTDQSGNIKSEIVERFLIFGSLDAVIMPKFSSYPYEYLTNEKNVVISGYATPNSTVTLGIGVASETATANEYGYFSYTAGEIAEGTYDITAADTSGLTLENSAKLIVDRTPPQVATLGFRFIDSNNVAVEWICNDTDVSQFQLYKNNVLQATIPGAATSEYSYNLLAKTGDSFMLVAADKAGNTAKLTKAIADTKPPTTPGTPAMAAHGTKSISFAWGAASDNVAVEKYEIYRADTLIDTVDDTVTSYTDTGLQENTAYQYRVYALDAAGNQSEAAAASLSTAALTISNSTAFSAEYIKEENPSGVSVDLLLDGSDDYYAAKDATVKLQYKLSPAEAWSELALTGISTAKSGTWAIEDLAVGTYTVRFHVADADGTEKTTADTSVVIKQDTIAPVVTIAVPSASSTLSGKDLTISGSATDNVEVSRVTLSYSLNGGSTFTDMATLTNEQVSGRTSYAWSHIFDASGLPSGAIAIKATAYDGRENSAEATVSLALDNTPPSPPYGFHISGTSEYIGLLWSYPDQGADSDFNQFKIYRSAFAAGPFEYVGGNDGINFYDTAANHIVADQLYYYYITAVDLRGNESEPTVTLAGMMATDDTPPTIASYLPGQNNELCKEATISVSLYDNSLLKQLRIEYKKSGDANWTDLTAILTDQGSAILSYDWDISALGAGSYQVKLTAEDISGLTSEQIINYTIKAYAAPVTPTGVSATGAGHRQIALSWSYAGDRSLLSGFRILRKGPADGDYNVVKYVKDPAAVSYTDSGLTIGDEYSYKIEAVDYWNATATSDAVSITASSGDLEKPVAVIAAVNLAVAKDRPITFAGSGSTDNDEIASYDWNFGDGAAGAGETAVHAYAVAGSYTVSLTVTDLAGNADTATVNLEVIDLATAAGMHEVILRVVDASTTDPLSGAEIKILEKSEETEAADITLVTDTSGQASVVLKDGDYSVQTAYSDYLLRTNSIMVSDGSGTAITVGMSRANMLVGSMSATEMTLDEILAAGIDVEDPDNQHVFKFAVVLEFEPLKGQKYQIPMNFFANNKGTILGYGSGWGGGAGGGFGFSCGGWGGTIYPVSKDVYLIIYGEACWLKEMFHVQLLLNNTSATDYIEDLSATLIVPEGLSLATMLADAKNQNKATQTVGTIAEQSAATVDWYVRGDKEGEYNLTAAVSGTYMPNPENFTITYATKNPIKVWASSALHLYVEAEKYAKKGVDYTTVFRLENVSNKSVYNLSLDILGGKFTEEFPVTDIAYTGDLGGTWNNGEILEIEELKPGESIEGKFIIKFDADVIEEDTLYMLTNMFGFTREGSTAEIPMTFVWVDNLIGDIFEDTILLDINDDTKKSYTITKFGAAGQDEQCWQTSKEHVVTVNAGTVTAVGVGEAVVSFANPVTGKTHLYSVIVYDSSAVFWKAGTFYYSNDGEQRGDFEADYLYSDSYFDESAYEYNHGLATMTLDLAMSAFAKYDDDTYKNYGIKSDNAKDLLTQLEFEDFASNWWFRTQPTTDSIGVAAANKKITAADGSSYTLIAVAIRGGGYEREWASNFTIGSEKHHQGFREARDQVVVFLNDYIANTAQIEGDVKIWITGFSRAAATANLVAAALTDRTATLPDTVLLAGGQDVYAYCFETPAGLGWTSTNTAVYNNIFSIVNPSDPVPKVAPAAWGFGRYGRTFYLPSAGTNVNYANLQKNMLEKYDQLPSVSASEYEVDNFHMISLDAERWKLSQDIFLNEFIDFLAMDVFQTPDNYGARYEESMRRIGETMGADYSTAKSMWRYFINSATPVIFANAVSQRMDSTATLLENTGGLGGAHYPELCLAWMQSLTLSSDYSFSGYSENTGYYKLALNCPVDIEVYDEDGNLLAGIVNNIPVDVSDSFIVSIFDEDGQKVIYLPANGTYSIVFKATGSGTMTYSVGEYHLSAGEFARTVNYYNIPINEGDVLEAAIVPSDAAHSDTIYTLNGTSGSIAPSEDLSGDEVERYSVEVKTSGNGAVTGGGDQNKRRVRQSDGCS